MNIEQFTRLLAVGLTLFQRIEIVLVTLASAVHKLLARLRRAVVKIAREESAAMSDHGWLSAPVRALEMLSIRVDERHFALVARVGDANGIRMIRACGVQALIATHYRLDAGVGANWTESALFQDCSIGRATDRAAGDGLVDRIAIQVDTPTEFALALLACVVALERAHRRRNGHHQWSSASFYWVMQ